MTMDQRTEEWHQARAGKFTASRVDDLLCFQADKWKVMRPSGTCAKSCDSAAEAQAALIEFIGKAKKDHAQWRVEHVPGGPMKTALDYLGEVICERLTGEPLTIAETFQMRWGKDQEPYAVEAYEIRTGSSVRSTGFVDVPDGPLAGLFGASPDGLVGEDGQLEIKCPSNSVNHLRCFYEGIPEDHHGQMEGQLLATRRKWVDFVSFDPRMPPHLQLFIGRYRPHDEWQDRIQAGVLRMEHIAQDLLDQLPKE